MMRTSALKRLFVPARQQTTTNQQAAGRITNLGPTVSAPRRIVQDMPPPGGFKPARIKRNMPNKFWSIGTTCVVMATIMGVGWYRYYKWYEKKCHLKKEEERLQLAMIPFLQAEHDITYTIKRRAFMKKVAVLMKDEEDFDLSAKFYHNKNYFAYPRVATELDVFEGTGLLEPDADVKPVA